MNNGEHARWNRTLVNAYWIWTLCSFVISMLGVLNDFNCVWWGPGHLEKWGDKAHAQYISRSANNINRHLTRNSCRALSWKAGHLEPSGLGAKEIALFPPPALETFIRICEIARMNLGREWDKKPCPVRASSPCWLWESAYSLQGHTLLFMLQSDRKKAGALWGY